MEPSVVASDERASAEQTRRLSALEPERILESASQGVIVADERGRVVFANSEAARLFGYERGDLVGRAVDELLPEHRRAMHEGHRTGYLAHPRTRRMGTGLDIEARRSDGTRFPVEIGLSAATTDAGTLVTAVIADISERKHVEDERSAALSRLAALNEIDRAILAAGSFEDLARRALARLGTLVPAHVIALSRFDPASRTATVVASEGPASSAMAEGTVTADIAPEMLATLEAGEPLLLGDLRTVTGASDRVPPLIQAGLRSTVTLGLRSEGALYGFLTLLSNRVDAFPSGSIDIVRDVADQLAVALRQAQMRDELQRHAAELEHRIKERTRDLEETNAELDAFAYSVAHDLRAPLRAMEGFGRALLEDHADALDETGRDYLDRIVRAASRMDELIQDLLAYSRLSRAEISLSHVDVSAAVTEAVSALADEIGDRRARLVLDEDLAEVPAAIANGRTLVAALQNLLSNAIKFVDDGVAPAVHIGARVEGDMIRIDVRDNGIGIASEHHDRIFRMLERLHGQERYDGTGIGLAIVRRGAERMGGRVSIESAPGRGSVFSLWLNPAVSA